MQSCYSEYSEFAILMALDEWSDKIGEKMQECALYKGGLYKQLQIESGTIRSIALLGVNTNNGAKFFMKS